MKGKMMAALLAPVLMMQVACNDAQQENAENEVDTAANKVETIIDNAQENLQDYRDETFVENVYWDNKEELLLLNLASTKGGAAVKDAAKKMKGDHEKLDKWLAEYAGKNNITVKTDAPHDDLETKEAGTDWDNDWKRKIVNAHEKVINKFERKANNANNEELKAAVTMYMPVLQNHLAMVKAMNEAK